LHMAGVGLPVAPYVPREDSKDTDVKNAHNVGYR
jgi:hypothetical protein